MGVGPIEMEIFELGLSEGVSVTIVSFPVLIVGDRLVSF
jgi:hypothetical protein